MSLGEDLLQWLHYENDVNIMHKTSVLFYDRQEIYDKKCMPFLK